MDSYVTAAPKNDVPEKSQLGSEQRAPLPPIASAHLNLRRTPRAQTRGEAMAASACEYWEGKAMTRCIGLNGETYMIIYVYVYRYIYIYI